MEALNGFKKSFLLVYISLLFLGCSGGGGDGNSNPADTTAPVTTALPGGGVYGSIQYVTLSSNEPATIYYSLDGTSPSVGGTNTTFGNSPITDIEIYTTTLKFFSIDTAGNQESVKSQSYIIDLNAPTISFTIPAPGPFGLLTLCTISWQSDEDGDYLVELGGTGTAGTGLELDSGSATAFNTVSQEIMGIQLSFDGATSLWVYVTDQFGHRGSSSLSLEMKPLAVIPIGGELWEIEMLPGGEKAYISNTNNDEIAVIDTNPLSETYHDEINTVSVGNRPVGVATTPDGSRIYVTNNGSTSLDIDSISVISTATDTVIATTTLGSATAPGGIAITPDGKRGYFTTFENKVMIVDTDPISFTYNLVVNNNISIQPLLLSGKIAVSPDGKIALVNWQGLVAHGVDVLDVDSSSITYNTLIGNIVPVISGISGSVAFSSDSELAYMTSSLCGICMADLKTYEILNSYSNVNIGGGIALTPDDLYLLHSVVNDTKLYVFDSSDLTLIGSVDLGAMLGNDVAVTPDGTQAYILRNPISDSSEVVMVPLQ